MAEAIGLASSIAGLITMAMKITELSYSYISDIRSAHTTQKQYLREVSALTEVLLRSEEVAQNLEDEDIGFGRPKNLSKNAVTECAQELEMLCSELRKPSPSIFWPIKEKTLRKHIEDLHRFRSIFTDFLAAKTLAVATATHRDVTRLGNYQNQKDLLEWIGNPKGTSGHVPDPLPDTGDWFLRSEAYKQWTAGSGPSLHWCYGPPGVGKSMLAALIIQDLSIRSEPIPTLHYWFDFGNRKVQTKESIWKDLLRQVIVQGNGSTIQALVSFRKELGLHRPASSKDLSDALKTVCAVQQLSLVLDGPDEMENPRDLKVILSPFIKANCRVLVTSRDIPEIRSTLNQASKMEVLADTSDLKTYVGSRFEENDLDELIERHPDLEKDILAKSRGIFLLVRLLVDHLVDLSTVKEMRKALQIYPTHLDQAFESSLQRIDAQSKSHKALAHRVMGWIISAERQLQMTELTHGLATEEGVDTIDEENLVSSKTILKVCGGLVIVQGTAVKMVHSTVHTWLRNRYNDHYQKDLADSCLRYLTMSSFSSGPAVTVDEMDTRITIFPFFSYAARHWKRHLDKTEDANTFESIDRLLDDSVLRSAAFQASQYKNTFECPVIRTAAFETIPDGHSALHFASYWNLPRKVAKNLSSGEEKNSTDTQMWTPLHWACFGQSQEAVETLLSHKANPNAKDSVGWTPLFWAALNGDTKTVKLLLQNGASHTERDIHDWTALRWAVASLQMDVVKILLEHHTNTLSNAHENGWPALKQLSFEEASRYFNPGSTKTDLIDELEGTFEGPSENENDYDDLLAVFQEKSFDIQYLWSSGRFDPPVGNAWRTMNKAEKIRGLDCYIEGAYVPENETAKSWKSRMLQSAIRDGKLLAVRLLLEAGAEVNFADDQTPLHTATFRKDARFAEILIRRGAHMEAHNLHKLTPLQQAVVNGFEETSRLLLVNGANVNVIYTKGPNDKPRRRTDGNAASKTPLMLACGLNPGKNDIDLPVRMVQMLLESGADINIKDTGDDGMSALHYAARARNPKILQLLLDAGSNFRELDKLGRTAMHQLVIGNSLYNTIPSFDSKRNCVPGPATECLAILTKTCGLDILNKKAEWKEHYKYERNSWTSMKAIHTPLSLAVVREDWEIFQALFNSGAVFETNIPLDQCLDEPFLELQLAAVEVLAKNGAVFPYSDRLSESGSKCGWVGGICLFSQDHQISIDEVGLFKSILEILIPRGFNIDATDWDGCTLLHKASQKGTPELVECLLDVGADPYQENKAGLDAFLVACLSQKPAHLKSLLGYTGKRSPEGHWRQHLVMPETLKDEDLLGALSKALTSSGHINKRLQEGTILLQAADSDHVDFIQALLVCGADPNIGDEKGQRPLHVAAEKGHTTVVKALIDSGATIYVSDEFLRTPLHLAAVKGNQALVDMLLSNGASPDTPDYQGWRPLHFAAWNGHTETGRLLIQAGASAGMPTTKFTQKSGIWSGRPSGLSDGDVWSGTPLHLASMAGNAELSRLLLQENVDVNARTDSFVKETEDAYSYVPTPGGGPTALHIALSTGRYYGRVGYDLDKGRLEIASMLIKYGASVEGVANHLRFQDVAKFGEFPELWDTLRAGITVEGHGES